MATVLASAMDGGYQCCERLLLAPHRRGGHSHLPSAERPSLPSGPPPPPPPPGCPGGPGTRSGVGRAAHAHQHQGSPSRLPLAGGRQSEFTQHGLLTGGRGCSLGTRPLTRGTATSLALPGLPCLLGSSHPHSHGGSKAGCPQGCRLTVAAAMVLPTRKGGPEPVRDPPDPLA